MTRLDERIENISSESNDSAWESDGEEEKYQGASSRQILKIFSQNKCKDELDGIMTDRTDFYASSNFVIEQQSYMQEMVFKFVHNKN